VAVKERSKRSRPEIHDLRPVSYWFVGWRWLPNSGPRTEFGHTGGHTGGKRERAWYSRYAKATFRKDRRLNIRLSSKDLEAIQKRALAEGLPYQTLISSLLHKYASGRLKEV
jgi:hypothetical protein